MRLGTEGEGLGFAGRGWGLLLGAFSLGASSCQLVGGYEVAVPSGVRSTSVLSVAPPLAVEAFSFAADAPTEADVDGVDPILYSAASLDERLLAAAEASVAAWTRRERSSFEVYLSRMGRYESFVALELEERGLPASLLYLPIVESGYSPLAISVAGATGLWQLTDPTARELGLSVGSVVDDRRDPIASTRAALEYLDRLHDEFRSWYLALAAYNSGPGRVRRLLERYGSGATTTGDARYLEIHAHLPRETRNFVPRLLAAAALARRPGAFDLPSGGPEPMVFDEVVVPDATSLEVVARVVGVNESLLRQLNPQYLRGFTPRGESAAVRVPVGRGAGFTEAFARIPPDERLTVLEHVIEPGETLSHIARRYGVRVSDLTAANGGVDPRRLRIGAVLVVPTL